MSYNESTQQLLDIIGEMSETMETFSNSIDSGNTTIDEGKINESTIESWQTLRDNVIDAVTEATEGEDAWLLNIEDNGIAGEGEEDA